MVYSKEPPPHIGVVLGAAGNPGHGSIPFVVSLSNHERANEPTPTHTPPADSRRIAKHKGITAADEVFIARRFCAHKAQSGDAQSVADGNSFYARTANPWYLWSIFAESQ